MFRILTVTLKTDGRTEGLVKDGEHLQEARAGVDDGRVLAPVWTQKSGCRIGIVALVQVRYSSWARIKRGRVEG